jgi:uncharacterized protein DUF4386
MTGVQTKDRQPSQRETPSVQKYARIAGVLFLISLVAGGFGEYYIPTMLIVPTDAASTAKNIISFNSLFRLGFAAYLIEAICDVALTLILYVLLRPVSRNIALLTVFFRLVNTVLYGMAEFFYFQASLILGGSDYLKTFSPDQLNALALLSLNSYRSGAGLFLVFSGVAYVLLGYLIFRSGYLPKFLGALLALSGVGFITSNFLLVLAPAYTSFVFLVPTIIAGLALVLWLFLRGVDVPKWEGKRASSGLSV